MPDPVVPHLNAMPDAARRTFLDDMVRLGDAVLAATAALRINYAMFGNLEPALHAHVIPRFDAEEPSLATQHPWAYDWTTAPLFDRERDAALLATVRAKLIRT